MTDACRPAQHSGAVNGTLRQRRPAQRRAPGACRRGAPRTASGRLPAGSGRQSAVHGGRYRAGARGHRRGPPRRGVAGRRQLADGTWRRRRVRHHVNRRCGGVHNQSQVFAHGVGEDAQGGDDSVTQMVLLVAVLGRRPLKGRERDRGFKKLARGREGGGNDPS